MSTTDRFKDAPWMTDKLPTILIGGVGGIGGNTLYCLAKTIPGEYYIIDPDTVVEHNVGTQFFKKSDIEKSKVGALHRTMSEYSDAKIHAIQQMMDSYCKMPIMISAFDNMEARKYSFELWKSQEERELFIDGRLRATLYEVYVVTKGREEEYERTLFDDADVDEGPCTFKQTAHFGMLIGARITQMVTNYLTNKALGEQVCQLPFFIREIGDAVLMETKE